MAAHHDAGWHDGAPLHVRLHRAAAAGRHDHRQTVHRTAERTPDADRAGEPQAAGGTRTWRAGAGARCIGLLDSTGGMAKRCTNALVHSQGIGRFSIRTRFGLSSWGIHSRSKPPSAPPRIREHAGLWLLLG